MKRTPVKPKRTKPRRGPMRSKAYRDWLNQKWCYIAEFVMGDTCGSGSPWKRADAAHTKNNGMGSKGPDSSCVPLCRKHHAEYDAGRAAFEGKYNVDMKKIAAGHYKRFLEEQL